MHMKAVPLPTMDASSTWRQQVYACWRAIQHLHGPGADACRKAVQALNRQGSGTVEAMTYSAPKIPAGNPVLRIGNVMYHQRLGSVTTLGGQSVILTGAQLAVFDALVAANGDMVGREELSRVALNRPVSSSTDRSTDLLIYLLRTKLPRNALGASMIHTMRGRGWCIRRDNT